VDRILKGENRRGREPSLTPGVGFGLAAAQSQSINPPVRAPVNFQMALNARTAEALGLTVPPSILLLADEVIE
jgi:hypothetical protein